MAKQRKKKSKLIKPETSYKISSAVIGFIGTFLILFNLNITGAVISDGSTVTNGIIGVFMVFLALLLYLRPLKKSFKKQ